MLKYIIAGMFLFQVSCTSMDKRFSANKEDMKSYCDQVMETSEINKKDKEHKDQYKVCLMNWENLNTIKTKREANMFGSTVLAGFILAVFYFIADHK
ncbi:MAG: hypothetical protein OXK80_03610 [Bdellovibrionales bacterium]|nr:hypothetical protein [Bdellovibrionales bacterium]